MAWSWEAFGNTRHCLEKQKVLEEMVGMGYKANIERINTVKGCLASRKGQKYQVLS